MGFNKEEAYRYALCMDITPQCFRFAVLDPAQKKILHFEEHLLNEFDKETVKALLKAPVLKHDYASYSLSGGTERNTLIPVDLFSHTKPKEAFKLNYPEPIDNLDYNRIPEHGIVNIFEFPLWLKSAFVIAFPRVKIFHRSTILLKGIFDQPTYQPKIHIYIEEGQFYLMISEKSKLTFFNRFDYKELADLVYYILFVLEQKEYDQNDFDMLLYGVSKDWNERSTFQNFFSTKVKVKEKPEKAEHFILAKQLLCV